MSDGKSQGKEQAHEGVRDVSAEVFTAFLAALERDQVDPMVVQRLRVALIQEKTVSERALRAAVLAEDPSP
jgi:hypothetical protein